MVEEHIHNLLFEHDCVIIPDFGGLITHYASAQVHPVKHTFSPPSKLIAFNETLKLNDGLLISTFAYRKKLPAEEAQAEVSYYVQQLHNALRANQQYEMKGVGIFRLNPESKIQFEYVPADNLFSHSFGLPDLISRPVLAPDVNESLRTFIKEKSTPVPGALPQKKWGRRLRRVYDSVAVMAIAGLSITALYVISLQNDYSQSSLNPFAIFDLTSVRILNQPADEFGAVEFPDTAAEGFAAPAEDFPAVPQPETGNSGTENITPGAEFTSPAEKVVPATPAEENKTVPAVPVAAANAGATKNITLPAATAGAKMATTIKAKTDRYYVIAGGYSTLENAHFSRKVANRYGAQGKVILPFAGSKLYRVSIADFSSKEEALVYLPGLKNKYGKNIWILNY